MSAALLAQPIQKVSEETKPDFKNPASLTAQAPEKFLAKFKTTKGDFTIEVTRAWAPLAADRFYNLVRSGFYDNCAFFRVVPGFVAQFGINPDPNVTKAWQKEKLKDEPTEQHNMRGRVAMAAAGFNARLTQVFIDLGNNTTLDEALPPFGEVTEGMDVVDKFHSYKDQQPVQQYIEEQGNKYLDASFPEADHIVSATLTMLPAGSHHPGAEKQ